VTYPQLGVNPVIDAAVLISPIPVSLLLASRPARALLSGIESVSRFLLRPFADEQPIAPQES
jgi:hypothetical protein